ncbi:hypothetical protein [Rhizobium rhizogenes]|uniref:hypothetical protein n=1 Tax=Rhizobium rhizogenes TaxID=359 RepID=UPI001574A2CC|nr:hypothetical protein [Rhizobium rhizogenes]
MIMQLTNTRIASQSSSAVVVEFLGEGDEMISVTMSNSDGNLNAENAIAHAKAVMVQLETFDVDHPTHGSINRYDALSNGNFDEADNGLPPEPNPAPAQDDQGVAHDPISPKAMDRS